MIGRFLKIAAIAVLSPFALRAQLVLSAGDGSAETVVTSVYGFGQIAAGSTKDVDFHARNTGTSAVTVTKLAMSGIGFSIMNTASIPYIVAPGNSLDFTMHFSGSTVGSYSANLQVNSTIVLLLATVVQGPAVSVASPCTGPDATGTINFGRVQQTGSVSCTFTVANTGVVALPVSPIAVTGAGFSTTQASAATIPAGQNITFTVMFSPSSAIPYSGTFTAGPDTYGLSGTGYSAPLSAPMLTFDVPVMSSGEQHTLSVNLSQPSPVAASGNITMTFVSSVAGITDDSAVQFVASGKRVVSFTVAQGATAVMLSGFSVATFATGTTAGKITFTMDAGAYGISGNATASATISPAPVSINTASTTTRVNNVEVTITGFDNTYSAGKMSFSFFDTNNNPLGAAITSDFTSQFSSYYNATTAGSGFLIGVTFPVTGNSALIGGVNVTMTNAAGTVQTQRLNFP